VDDRAFENFFCGAVGWLSGMTNAFPKEAAPLYNLSQEWRIDAPVLHIDCAVEVMQYIKRANQMKGMGACGAPGLRSLFLTWQYVRGFYLGVKFGSV
jgi:dihydrodipicolinate synthase/N-acetylneuraminate lyase